MNYYHLLSFIIDYVLVFFCVCGRRRNGTQGQYLWLTAISRRVCGAPQHVHIRYEFLFGVAAL